MSFKVLVSDPLAAEGIAILKEFCDVDEKADLSEDELVRIIGEYDALIVRSGTQVTARIIQAADRMKYIGRAGVGVDNIDCEAATRKGIIVSNAPEGNTLAATEHTIAMMMAMARTMRCSMAMVCSPLYGKWKYRLIGRHSPERVFADVWLTFAGTCACRCMANGGWQRYSIRSL